MAAEQRSYELMAMHCGTAILPFLHDNRRERVRQLFWVFGDLHEPPIAP